MFDPNNPFSDENFGFEIVDAPDLVAPPSSTSSSIDVEGIEVKLNEILSRVNKIPITSQSVSFPTDIVKKTDMIRVEEKIDKVLSMEIKELANSLEGTEGNIRAIIDEVEERKIQVKKVYTERMKELENLILPLLYNLLKNPDKEYIKWANRTEIINKQISKITSITRDQLDI